MDSVVGTQVVWFRNDLRVSDHAPLFNACRRAATTGDAVLPVFIVDPQWFGETSYGFPRVSSERARFLYESLVDLDRHLSKLGGGIRLFFGDTVDVLSEICEEVSEPTVSFHQEVSTEEKRVERRLRKHLANFGIPSRVYSPTTMCDWDEVPFSLPDTPEVFTKFRRLVEKRGVFSPPLPPPSSFTPHGVKLADERTLPEVKQFSLFENTGVAEDVSPSSRRSEFFRGGIDAGEARLKHYLWDTDALSRDKETRNGMLALDDSSKLSAWLALGCVSAKRAMHEVELYEAERVKNDSTYWLKFELLWRDFFIFMSAKHGSHLFRSGGLQDKPIEWIDDRILFEAWCEGKTGYPLVDANMRELRETGYMSNRGRQNVASFLTKNLGLDWRLGAEWFESQLIDHDPSLNYGNWNYAAGIGNDAREFRWFNINKQASIYDPEGDYVRHWLPELNQVPSQWIHQPWRMGESAEQLSQCTIGVDYPAPIVDLFQSAEENRKRHDRALNPGRKHSSQQLLDF